MSRPPPGHAERVPGPDAAGPRLREADPELIRILAIVGPTGTGKSAVAVRVAEILGGEIVGCDALQVYRGLDRATAKPSAEHRARIPHHLLDVADPRSDFSAADFVRLADAAIDEIVERGRVPVVAGGTGMYLRALLKGLVAAPPRNEVLRARLKGMASRFGPRRLHRWLEALDAASAARIPRGDVQRIVRAIEIRLSGEGASWSERLERAGTWSAPPARYEAVKVALDLPRATLDSRLAERVAAFFESGLVEEVRGLLASGVPASANAFKAIGYREVLAAIAAGADPEAARDDVVRSTRRYVKRQRTWFRKEDGVVWLDALDGPEVVAERIVGLWRARGR